MCVDPSEQQLLGITSGELCPSPASELPMNFWLVVRTVYSSGLGGQASYALEDKVPSLPCQAASEHTIA